MHGHREERRAGRSASSIGATRPRRPRSRRPIVEALEGRALMAYNVTQAFGVGGAQLLTHGTAVDTSGNVYMVGGFGGQVSFAPGGGGTPTTSLGTVDGFLAKYAYSSTGSASLVKLDDFGAANNRAQALAVTADSSGNLFVVGQFTGTMTFGGTTLTAAGTTGGFVAEVNASTGAVTWAKAFGGTGTNLAQAVTVDPNTKNVLVAGQYTGPASFGGGVTVGASGAAGAFVAEYTASGSPVYATGMSGGTTSQVTGVAVDPNTHEAVLVGQFAGTGLNFGGKTLNSAGIWDAFAARLSTTGAVKWVDTFGGTGLDQAKAVAVDPSTGNALVAGTFTGPVAFGSATLAGFGGTDAFVAQLSPTGTVNWADDLGGSGSDAATAVAVGPGGSVTVGGSFAGTATFGSSSVSLTSNGGSDTFLAQFSSAGAVAWAQGYGGGGNDSVTALAVDGTGRVTMVGAYVGPAIFGSKTLPAIGSNSGFVTQVADNTPPPPPPPLTFGVGGSQVLTHGTIVDNTGNVYVVGGFGGQDSFAPGGGGTQVTATGTVDGFLAKYSPTGSLMKLDDFGAANDRVQVLGVVGDASGDPFVVGQFTGSVTFGGTTLTAPGTSSSGFVVDVSPTGAVLWAKAFGGTGTNVASAVTLDPSTGNVYVAGQYTGPASFGNGVTVGTSGSSGAFVAEYTASGTPVYATGMSGGVTSQVMGVAVDPNTHEAVLVGQFAGTGLNFGGKTLNSAGNWDAFAARLSTTGAVKWVDSFGGTGLDQSKAVTVDPSTGNALVAGTFTGPVAFGSATLAGFGGTDAFVAQLSPTGTVNWADDLGGSGSDTASSVAVGPGGSVAVGGSFSGTATFGSSSVSLTSNGGSDAYVAQFNSAGVAQSAQDYGGAGNDTVTALAVDGAGRVTVVGAYAGPAIFGSKTLPAIGSSSAFVTQLGGSPPPPPPPSAVALGVGGSQMLAHGTAVGPSGGLYVAGGFGGQVSFAPGGGGTPTTSLGIVDAFLAKYSSTGSPVWLDDFGSANNRTQALGLTVDSSGDLFVVGQFTGTVTFGKTTLTAPDTTSSGFVAEVNNSTGAVTWAQAFGGTGTNLASAVAVDPGTGNVLVAGQYTGPASFGGTVTVGASGAAGAFVAEYTASGSPVYATGMSGGTTSQVTGVAVDPNTHEAVLVGQFAGTGLTFGTSTLSTTGIWGAFAARLSTTGAVEWVDTFGNTGVNQAKAVAVDRLSNIYVVGEFTGPATFGVTSLPGFGGTDGFVAQLSPSGTVNWADDLGGPGNDAATSVAVGSGGVVTVGGAFSGTATFGSSSVSLTSNGGTDAFLAQLDSTGTVQAAENFGGAGNDTVSALTLPSDGSGDIVVTGTYVGPMTIGGTALPNAGSASVFLARVKKLS